MSSTSRQIRFELYILTHANAVVPRFFQTEQDESQSHNITNERTASISQKPWIKEYPTQKCHITFGVPPPR